MKIFSNAKLQIFLSLTRSGGAGLGAVVLRVVDAPLLDPVVDDDVVVVDDVVVAVVLPIVGENDLASIRVGDFLS